MFRTFRVLTMNSSDDLNVISHLWYQMKCGSCTKRLTGRLSAENAAQIIRGLHSGTSVTSSPIQGTNGLSFSLILWRSLGRMRSPCCLVQIELLAQFTCWATSVESHCWWRTV